MNDFEASKIDLNGKTVLVTGGTGSFGKRLVRTILDAYEPHRLIIFSRDELKQVEMQRVLEKGKRDCLRFFIGDVRDASRLEMAMREVDYVVHAAALKQVPVAEYNPFECINTNVIGAQNVVCAALQTNVKRVIALSSDKAVSPLNLYGASKLAADKIFVAANNLSGSIGTRFSVVRYGNVVGSRGSVVPFFRKLIEEGEKELPITDVRMTRFWITLDRGVNFVLSCLEMMNGGEIFIPKIPSMKIVDLATALAPKLSHRIVGIRPGEKIHEILITADDARSTLELRDRYIIEPTYASWSQDACLDKGASRVPELFHYSSDSNKDWLDTKAILHMVNEGAEAF
ncbi:MAG: UDP-N-acetylglucosamine 4,6-dehydratase (inverting) [Nitrospinota bacterium]|jgi:UDP-N-acetylglucosamine 4,6-dehydratase|nr:UDP-N-acetylglucosamine 4,6-dehydratase (inverting) [Nitrospinota bacterium]